METTTAGRGLFWLGLLLGVASIPLFVVHYMVLRQLTAPWYVPVVATLGALLLVLSLARRGSIPRALGLLLVAALAGFEWFFLVSLARLPRYDGPARAGQSFPAFQTALADGTPLTEKDLQDSRASVLTFFRGRW